MKIKHALIILLYGFAVSLFAGHQPGTPVQTLQGRAEPYLASALAAGDAFVSVSSASGLPNIAPGSLATAFGTSLVPRTESGTAPYPTSLGGISLQVVDNTGAVRLAPLLYVSPTQINYLIPNGTPSGTATMNIVNGTGNVLSGTAQIQSVAPTLFTANDNGQGVVAATAYRTIAPSTLGTAIPVFQCSDGPGTCASVPIALGVDTPIFVTFYATGLRGRSGDSAVSVTIGTQAIPAKSIASLGESEPLAGIDQVTVGVPLALRGAGEVDVVLTVDGKTSNIGRINIQ